MIKLKYYFETEDNGINEEIFYTEDQRDGYIDGLFDGADAYGGSVTILEEE